LQILFFVLSVCSCDLTRKPFAPFSKGLSPIFALRQINFWGPHHPTGALRGICPFREEQKLKKNTRQFSLFPLEDEIFYFFLPSEMAIICWFSNANVLFNFQHEIWKQDMHVFKSMNATSLVHKKRLLWLQSLFKMTFQNGCVCCCCWNNFFYNMLSMFFSNKHVITQHFSDLIIWCYSIDMRRS